MTAPHSSRQECLARLQADHNIVEPKQHVTVDRFRPEDAEGVARLYFAIYGDGFPIDYVYDPVRIAEANNGPDLHSIIARTDSGDVVGLAALFRAAPGNGILETGGLMILPEYRLGMLALKLIEDIITLAKNTVGLNAIFGQSVTDHITTQKINKIHKFHATAFEVESMPPRPDGDKKRICLLDEFKIFKDIRQKVYLPDAHDTFLRGQYDAMSLTRDYLPGVRPEGQTKYDTLHMPSASLAKSVITSIGEDFTAVLKNLENDNPDQYAYHLHLPLSDPGLPDAVEVAHSCGYFFGGLLPLWRDSDVLLMQKLTIKADYTAPKLLTDQAKQLFGYVRKDWQRTTK